MLKQPLKEDEFSLPVGYSKPLTPCSVCLLTEIHNVCKLYVCVRYTFQHPSCLASPPPKQFHGQQKSCVTISKQLLFAKQM